MLEGVLLNVLNKHLSPYVEGLDKEQLRLGVWKGDLSFTNLRIKSSVLTDLDQPITINSGRIGSLRLKIPWKQLFPSPKKPVEVYIDDVLLLVSPIEGSKYDPELEKKLVASAKKSAIQAWEEQLQQAKEEAESKPGFVEKLVVSIINNIQIRINTIHIRFEQKLLETPFTLGVVIDKISAETTDENWKPAFIPGMPTFVHKVAKIEGLAMYCETGAAANLHSQHPDTWPKAGRHLNSEQYLIKPVTFSAKLVLNTKGEKAKAPKIKGGVNVSSFVLEVDGDQMKGLYTVLDEQNRLMKIKPYRQLRQRMNNELGDIIRPRNRWRYIIEAVLHDVRERRRVWRWEHFARRRDQRKAYKQAYREIAQTKKPSKSALEHLEELEENLDTDDILRFRDQVQASLSKKKESTSGGWFSSWFGGGSSSKKHAEEASLTDEDKKAIYSAIGYDEEGEEEAAKAKASAAYVETDVNLNIDSIGVVVYEDGKSHVSESAMLSSLALSNIAVGALLRPGSDGVEATVEMQKLAVNVLDHDNELVGIIQPSPDFPDTRVMYAKFQLNPLDGHADTALELHLQPVEVTYLPDPIAKLAAVFQPPPQTSGLIEDVSTAAAAQAAAFSESTATGLLYAIETHKTVDLDIHIGAPRVIVPSTRATLVADLGRIRIKSDLTKRSEATLKNVDVGMYDTFNIEISRVAAVLVGDSEDVEADWRAALKDEQSPELLLDPASLELVVEQCIQQQDPRYARAKAKLTLNSVVLRISDVKYKRLMSLLAEIAPPSEDTGQASSATADVDADTKSIRSRASFAFKKARQALQAGSQDALSVRSGKSPAVARRRRSSSRRSHGSSSRRSGVSSDDDDDFYSCDEDDDQEESTKSSQAKEASSKSGTATIDTSTKQYADWAQLQFSFHLHNLSILLCENKDAEERPLVEMNLLGLSLPDFVKRPFDMSGTVSLDAIDIIDHLAMPSLSSPRKHLLQSNPSEKLPFFQTTRSTDTLVQVFFSMADPQGPFFQQSHKGIAQAAELTVGDIRLTARQESLSRLLSFVTNMLASAAADDVSAVSPVPGRSRSGTSTKAETASITPSRMSSALSRPQHASAGKPQTVADKEKEPAPDSYTQMRFKASLSTVQLLLAGNKQNVASAVISGLSATMESKGESQLLRASLKSIRMADLTHAVGPHTLMLTSRYGDALDAQVTMYGGLRPLLEPDMDCRVRMAQLRVVYLASFVSDLSTFAAGITAGMESPQRPQTPTPTAREDLYGSHRLAPIAEAAETAESQQPQSQAVGSKIKLDVEIKAPHIVVPCSRAETDAMTIDLGVLRVTNDFALLTPQTLASTSSAGQHQMSNQAIVDDMDISLTEITVQFAQVVSDTMHPEKDVTSAFLDRVMVEPVEIGVSVKRYLTPQAGENPNMVVSAKIGCISTTVDSGDLGDIMRILSGNLGEAPTLPALSADGPTAETGSRPGVEVDLLEADASNARASTSLTAAETDDGDEDAPSSKRALLQSAPAAVGDAGQDAPTSRATVDPSAQAADLDLLQQSRNEARVSDAVAAQLSSNVDLAPPSLNIHAAVELDTVSLKVTKRMVPLTRVSIDKFRTEARIFDDGSISANVAMYRLNLADIRSPAVSKFPEMISHRAQKVEGTEALDATGAQSSSAKDQNMLDLRFEKIQDDQTIAVSFHHMRVIANMNFVMELADFAAAMQPADTAAESGTADDADVDDDDTDAGQDNKPSDADARPAESNDTTQSSPSKTDEVASVGSLRIHADVAPEVIVIADHTDPLSRALRLTFQTNALYSSNTLQQNAQLSVSNFMLSSLRPWAQQNPFVELISPFSLSVVYSCDVESSLVTASVDADPINMTLSHSDINAVLKVLAGLSQEEVQPAAPAVRSRSMARARSVVSSSALFKGKSRRIDHKRWYLSMGSTQTSRTAGGVGPDGHHRYFATAAEQSDVSWLECSTAQIELPSIDITLVDDSKSGDVPLILATAAVLIRAKDFTNPHKPTMAWADVGLSAAYFNPASHAWEPIIEPVLGKDKETCELWSLQAHIIQNPPREHSEDAADGQDSDLRSLSLAEETAEAKAEAAEITDATDVLEDAHDLPQTVCLVTSSQSLELTLSTEMMNALLSSSFLSAGEEEKDDRDEMPSSNGVHTPSSSSVRTHAPGRTSSPITTEDAVHARQLSGFKLVNETGHHLDYAVIPNEREAQQARRKMLKGDTNVGVTWQTMSDTSCKIEFPQKSKTLGARKALRINKTERRNISLRVKGCTPLHGIPVDRVGNFAHRTTHGNTPIWLCVEVSLEGAITIITVRSTLRMMNLLHVPIDVGYDVESGAGVQPLAMVEPEETFEVPLTVAYTGLRIRPAGLAYAWSKELLKYSGTKRTWVHCLSSDAQGDASVLDDLPDFDQLEQEEILADQMEANAEPNQPSSASKDEPAGASVSSGPGDPRVGGSSAPAAASPASSSGRRVSISMTADVTLRRSASAASDVAHCLQVQAVVLPDTFALASPPPAHPHHVLSLVVPVIVQNLVPHTMEFQISSADKSVPATTVSLEPGQKLPLLGGVFRKVYVRARCPALAPDVEDNWGPKALLFNPSSRKPEAKCLIKAGENRLALGMVAQPGAVPSHSALISVFAPYWVVNRTPRDLKLRQHASKGNSFVLKAEENIKLFGYADSGIGTQKRAVLRLMDCAQKWCSPLNLDTVGATGTVDLPMTDDGNLEMSFGLSVSMASDGLSKIVILEPHYVLVNSTLHTIYAAEPGIEVDLAVSRVERKVKELGLDPDVEVGSDKMAELLLDENIVMLLPDESKPFLPEHKKPMICFAYDGMESTLSDAVPIHKPTTAAIATPLSGQFPGQHMEYRVTRLVVRPNDTVLRVHFERFDGVSDVRVENHCENNVNIQFRQASPDATHRIVAPGQCMDYLREFPMGPSEIEWSVQGSKASAKQELSAFEMKNHQRMAKHRLWSVCFPDGGQVVLITTDVKALAQRIAKASGLAGRSSNDVGPIARQPSLFFSLGLLGVGMSLVDTMPREVAYFSLRSRTVWEYLLPVPSRWGEDWGRFPRNVSAKLEAAFQALAKQEPGSTASNANTRVKVEGGYVDLVAMELKLPESPMPLAVRRHQHGGLSLVYIEGEEKRIVRLCVESMQLDNQLPHPYVPTILAPATVKGSAPVLPVVKALVVQTKAADTSASGVLMMDRLSVLLQQLDVSASERFLLSLAGLIPAGAKGEYDAAKAIAADVKYTQQLPPSTAEMVAQAAGTTRISWRLFELHPIAINVSFMLTADTEESAEDVQLVASNFIRTFLDAVGVAIVNINDVPFRLNSLSLQNVFTTQDELVLQIVDHFKNQAIREGLKVLGCLDFIGNPVKFFDHISTGVTDLFYEPLLDGMQSMASNALAGASGVVTSVTGTIANGFAAMSMDREYQRARQQAASRSRTRLGQLAHGGESLMRGVFEGATGLFLQPIRGAQEGGAVGFFKGVGRGLLGVIAKPVAGAIDMTTSTVDLIRRAVETEEAVKRARLPRHIGTDGIIRIYNDYEAEGLFLLQTLSQTFRRLNKDVYIAHLWLRDPKKKNRRIVALFTHKHIVLVPSAESLSLDACIPLSSLSLHRPVPGKGLEITYKEETGAGKATKRRLMLPCPRKDLLDLLLLAFQRAEYAHMGFI